MAKNLVKKIQNFAFQNELWNKGDKIVVGVSGGPDSVCLLDILMKLKNKCDFEILIAHVNYHLRGKDSDQDEKFVRNFAKNYDLKIQTFHPKAKPLGGEEEWRDIRYQYFEKVRKENDYNAIAVAHNLDDQAETFLMRIIRGAGLAGMSAMKAKNGNIIRPLLETSREEIVDYLKNNKLSSRIDKTNRDLKYFRNQIRHQLIPYLEKRFNPNIKKLLAKNAMNIAEDYGYILKQKKHPKARVYFSVSELTSLHPAEQNQAIRDWIKNYKGDLKNITTAHTREIIKMIKSRKNKNQQIEIQNLKLIKKGDKLTILWKK